VELSLLGNVVLLRWQGWGVYGSPGVCWGVVQGIESPDRARRLLVVPMGERKLLAVIVVVIPVLV
jgi:hypothetical protein